MKRFFAVVGLGVGVMLGGGLVYALYNSESVRLLSMFLLGAFLFGSTVLLTALFINRQWTKALGESRTTHNHRYQVLRQPPPTNWNNLLPPPVNSGSDWWPEPENDWQGEEVVA